MKQSFTLLLLLLVFPVFLFAQANFKPGLVVTTDSDTLKGYIDYQEWYKTPEAISFKSSLVNNTVQKYTLENCYYFEITGHEAYYRFIGPISRNPIKTSEIATGPEVLTKTDTVFLKESYRAPLVSLLTYTDDIKTRYFVKDEQQHAVQELLFVRYYTQEANRMIKELTPYKGHLWSLASKYGQNHPTLQKQIERAQYTER